MPKKLKTVWPRPKGVSIDGTIRAAAHLDRAQCEAHKRYRNFVKRVLIPLARREGYRKGDSFLLKGAHNDALVTRVLDVFITDQAAAAALPGGIRRLCLVRIFKPSELLKKLARDGVRGLPYKKYLALTRFIEHAVKSRRHWRVAKLNVRSASSARSAVRSARRKAA